jgi:hypothetical protein
MKSNKTFYACGNCETGIVEVRATGRKGEVIVSVKKCSSCRKQYYLKEVSVLTPSTHGE